MNKNIVIGSFLLTGLAGALIGFRNAPEKNAAKFNNWSEWSAESLQAYEYMILHYGEPDERLEKMAIWYNCSPWKWTIVYSDAFDHDFPVPHKDVIEQCMAYRVPWYRMNDIGEFDGSIEFSRTRGETKVRCANEAINFLSINMVNEIVTRKKDVNTARKFFADEAAKYMSGEIKDPYTKKFLAMKQMGTLVDPDTSIQIVNKNIVPTGLTKK